MSPPSSTRRILFGLPRSLNMPERDPRLERLRECLEAATRVRVEIQVIDTYQELAKKLQRNELEVVWAPPFVAARLEIVGFRVLLRGVRGGASTYRSAILARPPGCTVEGLKGKRAAWVDQESVSGYLLPLAFLKEKGLSTKDFVSQEFTGSFVTAVERVLSGRADFTAVFAPPASAQQATGLGGLAPGADSQVGLVAYTEEVPHSGLVAAAHAIDGPVAELKKGLQAMSAEPERAQLVQQVFGMEAFEEAPKLGYKALYRLATATF